MGAGRSKVKRREGFEVLRDVAHLPRGACEAKGRVLCVGVSEPAGLVLAGTTDAVLAWRLVDCTYYRAFPTGSPVETILASANGAYVFAGTQQDGRPVVRRFLLTRRAGLAAFEDRTGFGGERSGLQSEMMQALDWTFTINVGKLLKRDWIEAQGGTEAPAAVMMNEGVTRLCGWPDDSSIICVCAVPHIVVWNLEEGEAQTVIPGGYPKRDAPFGVLEKTKHFVLGRGRSLELLRWGGEMEREVPVTGLPGPVEVVLIRSMCIFAAAGSTIAKVNILSGIQLFTWQAQAHVRCLQQAGGILFSAGECDALQMWDGRCGRRLGAAAVTQTQGVRSQCLLIAGTTVMVADDPEKGKGFQSLLKVYDARMLLTHVPWLSSYDEMYRVEHKWVPSALAKALGTGGTGAVALATAKPAAGRGARRRKRSEALPPEDPELMARLVDQCAGVFTLDQVRNCRRLFHRHDADNNAVIDRAEFTAVGDEIRKARAAAGQDPGPRVTLAAIEAAFNGWDFRGGLPFEEFVRALARHFSGSDLAVVASDDELCDRVTRQTSGTFSAAQVRLLMALFRGEHGDGDTGHISRDGLSTLAGHVADMAAPAPPLPEHLLDQLWDAREDPAGLAFGEFAVALARHCSQAQRAAVLLTARRDSTWSRHGAMYGGRESIGAALAEKPPPMWTASPLPEGAEEDARAALVRTKRGEEERVRARSRQRREREAVDPRRVVLRLATPPGSAGADDGGAMVG